MEKEKIKLIARVAIPLVVALISLFIVTNIATSTEFHKATIQSLDDKKKTVMELTGASTAASAAITLLPGDTGTPIAEKLADLSTYFLFVLCAIFLEKYLVTITGYAAFQILIPIACILFSINVFVQKEMMQRIAIKLALFGLVIFAVIPASVKVSNLIEKTYGSSIEESIEKAKENTKVIQDSTTESNGDDEGFLSSILSKIQGGVTELTTRFENILSSFVEAIAVLIVTSCVIPIAVLVFFSWIVKMLFGIDIDMPKTKRRFWRAKPESLEE